MVTVAKPGERVSVACYYCGKEISLHPYRIRRSKSGRFFCCPEHRAKWMSTVRGEDHCLAKREKRKCLFCGKEFKVRPSEKKKYCCLECYHASKTDGKEKYCKVCGKQIKRKSQIYCSRECMGKDRQKHITKKCPVCGRNFRVRPCEVVENGNTCSHKCASIFKKGRYYISDKEMATHLKELKVKLGRIPNLTYLKYETENSDDALHWSLYVRRGGLRYWQKRLFGTTTYCFIWETTCIDAFNDVLGYPEFKTQKTFKWLRNYQPGMKRAGVLRVDLYYPKHKLCVEFDGEGHFQEIPWATGTQEPLELVQHRDSIKNKLIPEHGLKLLRFRYDEPLTREHILKRLSEVGVCPEDIPKKNVVNA